MAEKRTFIFQKDPAGDVVVQFDLTDQLMQTENIINIDLGPISPVTPNALFASISSGANPQVTMDLQGGTLNVSYGFQVVVTTNVRVFTCLCAVSVMDNSQVPYVTNNPLAFEDLVDTIEAGNSAIGSAIFAFPPTYDPRGGFVTWELLTSDGTVYASGNAFDYEIQSNGLSNVVNARAVINVPSTVPPSDLDQKYLLRYTLDMSASVDNEDPNTQVLFYSMENVTVTGLNNVPLGTQPLTEMQGAPANPQIVLDKLYDNVVVELYAGNKLLGGAKVTQFERVSSGYFYTGTLDTSSLPVSLVPYTVVWSYGNNSSPNQVFTETTELWIVNPSIMTAVADVRRKVSKAATTIYGRPDLIYTNETLLAWLRRGMDKFNFGGAPTSFTMTNALGPIREFWLLCAEVAAIESQYLAEGEKAFDFQGQAISLSVDRTGMLDAAASKIQSVLDSELKPFKQNLVIKGNTSGDGSADPSKLQRGAIGGVGITITQASIWGGSGPGIWTRYR